MKLDVTIRRPGIFTALIASAALAFFLATALLFLPIQKKVQLIEISGRAETIRHAAQSIQLAGSTLFQREWDSLVGFSGYADTGSYDTTRSLADTVVLASTGVTWVGFAGLNGKIVVGSDGRREGEDVSDQGWFQSGLRGDRASLPQNAGGTGLTSLDLAVVNLSRPVRGPDGEVAGVAVYTVDMAWFTGFLAAAADRLEVDIAILSDSGEPVFSHGARVATPISNAVKIQAQLGSGYAGFTRGEDRARYVAGVIPDVVAGDMPDLNLALVVRAPVRGGVAGLGAVVNSMIWFVIGLFAVIGIVAFGFALYFLRPISVLAEAAASIADGKTVYPRESHSSREAMLLSSALIRLRPEHK